MSRSCVVTSTACGKATPYLGGTAQGSLAVVVKGTPPATETTVPRLTNGSAYTFEVVATNSIGASPESKGTAAVTPIGPPTAPTGVSATRSDGSATVAWRAPSSDGGKPVTSYKVTPFLKRVAVTRLAVTISGSPPETSATVPGLANGSSYQFGVIAGNSVGSSSSSSLSTAVVPAGAPLAPQHVNATASNSSATVSWTAPSDNGAAITAYVVTPVKAGVTESSLAVTVSGARPATTATVRGLSDGVPYSFSVTARNSIGTSNRAASRQVTPVHGIWVASSTGKVVGVGVRSLGSGPRLGAHAHYVALLAEPTGLGYLLIGSNGSVHAFGDAKSYGSAPEATVVGASLTAGGRGYLLLLAGGGIKSFGDAKSYGATHHQSVVGVAATPNSKGYMMFLSDGGVKAFGDARSLGSVHGQTVTAGAIDSSGNGYYLLTANGEVHHFGKATYFGSTKALGYSLVPAAIDVIPGASGYLELATNGTFFAFGPGSTAYAQAKRSVVSGTAIGIGLEP